MEIKFTEQEAQGIFLDALCNGLGEIYYYGLVLEIDDDQYSQARAKCKGQSYEDVLLQILLDGNSLTLIDDEDEDNVNTITIQDVYDRLPSVPIDHLIDAISGHDDGTTADVILQTIFLNDVIYG